MIILLDPGHGIETKGKSGPNYGQGPIHEYALNRDIVARIFGGLQLLGIKAVNLVPECIDVSLADRVKRANDYIKEDPECLFLSIHSNMSAQPNTGSGYEIHVYETKPKKALNYAQIFSDYASAHLSQFRNRGIMYSDFYVLRNTVMPAVLSENLFYDNETDYKYLIQEKARQNIAELHINAIKKIIYGV